jgi:hypothetical protein
MKPESGGSDDRLTSELIFLGGDSNWQELIRRLTFLKLTDEQSAEYIAGEEVILKETGGLGVKLWAKHIYNGCYSYPEELPDPRKMTLSEIVLLMDEAIVGWAEWIPAAMRDAVCRIAGIRSYSSPYDNELRARFHALGFNTEQYISFVANESLIIKRLKWKKKDRQPWK